MCRKRRGERNGRCGEGRRRREKRACDENGDKLLPGINVNAGQSKLCVIFPAINRFDLVFLIAGYIDSVAACIATHTPLMSNPNRAGFLGIAQLPPIFLLGTKNSLFSLFFPPFLSYTHPNPLRRWARRSPFLAVVIHGSLYIRNYLVWNIPILGQQKEASGVAAFGVHCVLVLGSLKWVRKRSWGLFYGRQYVSSGLTS
jgi:ferric-chelate reductase